MQVAPVTKVLGAVIEMVKKGNRVVFDRDEKERCTSHIFHKPTGNKIEIHEVGPRGAEHYEFDMWVQVGKNKPLNQMATPSALKRSFVHANKFDKLASNFETSDHLTAFTRLA